MFDTFVLDTYRPDNFRRLHDWFGIWAMHESSAMGLFRQASALDLRSHVLDSKAAVAGEGGDREKSLYQRQIYGGIAVIDISGTMMKYASSFDDGTSTVLARRAIRAAVKDPAVDAIMLVLDTPGGTVAGTPDLANDVAAARQKKRLWTYGEDLCASAGYWTGAQGEQFRANANASIGSIGVFAAIEDSSGLAEAMQIKVHLIKAGAFKGAGVPGTVITDDHLAEWQRSINTIYGQFIDAVAKGRKMDRAKVEALADGRVHIGQEAVKLGLIDRVSSLDEALADLRDAVVAKTVSAPSQPKGSQAMSTETPAAPTAATLSELKAACEGAPADFLMAQLEANATVGAAMKAWNAKLRADLTASQTALEAATKRANDAEAKATIAPNKPLGVVPPKVTNAEPADTSATDEWNEKLAAQMKAGKTRQQAIAIVNRDNPGLRQRMLAEHNTRA